MEDYEVIIAWNSDQKFIAKVENVFNNSIVMKEQVSMSIEERGRRINEMYAPIPVPTNSTRCQYKEPITVFLVKLPAKYEYVYRTEGYRLCNMSILNFKSETRKEFDFNIFHCSDNVEEAKKALEVFDLRDKTPLTTLFNMKFREPIASVVHVDNIYHIRHVKDGSYKIVPIKDSVTVKRLMGYSNEELIEQYSLLHTSEDSAIVQDKSLNYFGLDFDQTHPECDIYACVYKDKFIITDGKHRSALLYANGYRHLYVTFSQAPCSNEIIHAALQAPEPNSHLENFHKFIYALNNKNIKFIVIRGHKTLPKTADTDLDIIIHPDSYAEFLKLTNEYIKQNVIAFNVEKSYKHPAAQLWYRAFRTVGTHNKFLTNGNFQMDTYNNAFFFFSQTEGALLSRDFLNYLFNTKIKRHNLNVPGEIAEMVLLFCRTWIDLGGKWKPKHKARFDELAAKNSMEEFKNILRRALEPKIQHIINNI